jgi:chromosome segregation ATPase
MHVPPPRAPLPSVSGDTRAVGTYFARLEGKVDEANANAQQVANEWAGAQDRLDNLEARLSQCIHGMAKLSDEFGVVVSAHARLVVRIEANEAAVQTLPTRCANVSRRARS